MNEIYAYRARLLFFRDEPGLDSTIVEVLDECTEDAWGGEPDFWRDAKEKYGADKVRELVVLIPGDAVNRLWDVETVEVEVDEA